jgi:hypothetical protein
MVMGQKDIMAQAVYLAQLEAAKNNCKCRTCQILRKATSSMTDQFLQEPPANPGPPGVAPLVPSPGTEEV